MNLPSSMAAHLCIRAFAVLTLSLFTLGAQANWEVDFSRRKQDLDRMDTSPRPARGLASVYEETVPLAPILEARVPQKEGFLTGLFEASGPVQEVVVLHTEEGFVPSTLRLQKDGNYQVRVVNINSERKNVSFLLDAFSEHHGTYFGKMKSFVVTPKTEGVFAFHCPETGAEGQIVVTETQRSPASQD